MRPLRVEFEGFSAYRDNTVVSFVDTDLFAFVGPTGSGKSSVIDAITFALYGSVVRYQNTGAVAPVVNAQSAEAKVRLDFEVSGVPYTAVRVVRRTKTGATTKEARLESRGEVLAGDARSLDDAVVGLIGLTFEQFTKTVVLPQGEFAAFLHAKASERQDLLVRLLDLGLYGEMAQAARIRERAASSQLDVIDRQLDDLGAADIAQAVAADARSRELTELGDTLRAQLVDINAVDADLASLSDERSTRFVQRNQLRDLQIPEAAKVFAKQRTHAADDVTEAERALTEARKAHDDSQAALAAGPDEHLLDSHREGWARLGAVVPLLADAERVLEKLNEQVVDADASVLERQAVLGAKQLAHEQALVRVGAADLRHALHEGEPCPVCEQVVKVVPTSSTDRDTNGSKGEVATAQRGYNQAQRARQQAGDELAKQREVVATLRRERDGLRVRLADAPARSEVDEMLRDVLVLRGEVETFGAAWRQAELVYTRSAKALANLDETERELRRALTAVRDDLAALDPPAPSGIDLLADWLELAAWGDDARDRVGQMLDALAVHEADLLAKHDRKRSVVNELAPAHDVDGSNPRLLEALARAAARSEAEAERIRAAVAQVQRLRTEADSLRQQRDVAHELAGLLNAKGFEQWLLEEALDELVAGATERLFSLSSGQFSLQRDDKGGFSVIDHRNADEVRSVKTLSGSETFLASLALALALADNTALLSSADAPKLESIFLDEGFGTLDSETLDVVASAIEELGATGRLVGVVTHIRELADRLPVRFEVTKLGSGSVIERVEQ